MTARAAPDHRRPVFTEGVARWPYRIVAVDSTTGPAATISADHLHDVGIEVSPFSDGASALICMSAEDPAAILAPTEMLGVEFLYFVTAVTDRSMVPVIVGLTGEPGSPERAYQALEMGARALIPLPARAEQLASLTQRMANKRSAFATPREHAPISIDCEAHRVQIAGNLVNTSPLEFDTLRILMTAAPNPVTNQELVRLLSADRRMTIGNLTRIISRIRVKLAAAAPDQPDLIETIRSYGYRMRSVPERPHL